MNKVNRYVLDLRLLKSKHICYVGVLGLVIEIVNTDTLSRTLSISDYLILKIILVLITLKAIRNMRKEEKIIS